ncbi:MAG: hypothetical protein WBC44_14405 [Planctomycetaceae bacterium]
MFRTCIAILITLCGLTAVAPAQVYSGYSTYYGPSYGYSHAPAYSNSSYSTGYGPLRVFDWRWWSGAPPYRNTAYTSPYWGGSYGAPAYTAAYAPTYAGYASTSYYAPSIYSGAMYAPSIASADTCCMVPTTPCCGTGLACAGGNCPGGNCAMNYSPGEMSPTPDPSMSGSSGSQRFESESDPGAVDPDEAGGPREEDGFRRSSPERPNDDYDGTSRGAGYGPERAVEQRDNGSDLPKAPIDLPDADVPDDGFSPAPTDDVPSEGLEQELDASEAEPAADRSLLDLDSKLTQAPSLRRERHSMRARFGSPSLARTQVDPATLPAAVDLRLVKK